MNHAVEVLLSTYNGERYLRQLLDSVWAQRGIDIMVSVRDDGSTDGTLGLLEDQRPSHPRLRLTRGDHVGAAQSFMALLREVGTAVGYAAFCDQDDVWLPDKLQTAVRALDGVDGPALYCSAIELVREDLSPIRAHRRCTRGPSFENALVENIATGCTIVLNRAAIKLLGARLPKNLIMHDAWSYLVIAGCGQIIYDPTPWVLYRLHGSNAVGVGGNLVAEWAGRVNRQVVEGHQRRWTHQAEELNEMYRHELQPDAVRRLDEFLLSQSSLRGRLSYAVRGGSYFQRRSDDLVYRALYALRRV